MRSQVPTPPEVHVYIKQILVWDADQHLLCARKRQATRIPRSPERICQKLSNLMVASFPAALLLAERRLGPDRGCSRISFPARTSRPFPTFKHPNGSASHSFSDAFGRVAVFVPDAVLASIATKDISLSLVFPCRHVDQLNQPRTLLRACPG